MSKRRDELADIFEKELLKDTDMRGAAIGKSDWKKGYDAAITDSIPREDAKELIDALNTLEGIMEGCYIKESMIKKSDIDIATKALATFTERHGEI